MALSGLRQRLLLVLVASLALAWCLHAGLTLWPLPQALAAMRHAGWLQAQAPQGGAALLWTVLLWLPLALWLATWWLAPLRRLLRALEGAVLSYRDGDFSMSIAPDGHDELGALVRQHSALGQALRDQRQQLAQRELLLDAVVQHTPVALLLVAADRHVVYANLAARQLLGAGRSLVDTNIDTLLASTPEALRQALAGHEDCLFTLPGEQQDESFHLAQRPLLVLGQPHQLLVLRRLTRELSRQEVATWKRVIRVISHELNNSLAPISSLAHSGATLARRGDVERLAGVFDSIGERASHLHGFLQAYARFAKLPTPQIAAVDWAPFIDALAEQHRFVLDGGLPAAPGHFDAAQVAQALINLLRNAHEAGGDADAVSLSLQRHGDELRLQVADRGPGMSDAVMAQALLPFYSTKRSGTGIGLALAREIAEAHGGRITLAHRDGGGLVVSLVLRQLA